MAWVVAAALIATVCGLCFSPKLRLTEKKVTLEAGQAFDAESYIKKPKKAEKDKVKIAEEIDNSADSCASLTDTSADGINVFVCAVNGNLAS